MLQKGLGMDGTAIERRGRKRYFKDLSRRDYIERAYEIIENEGVEAVSIRRMAKEFGCSSTSMYRYFDNIEELIYYANLIYLDVYLKDLDSHESGWKTIWDTHIGIWEGYARTAFHHPQAFNIIFFSSTSRKLTNALREFYSMFPERINIVSPYLQVMLQSTDLKERDKVMTDRCVEAGVIEEKNAERMNHMVCTLYQGYLKGILDYGIQEEEIESQVQQFRQDVTDICWLYANEKGRKLLSE
ncbi:MAG: TetR/AcrR family transcriptional regulator [Eubacteriales bacterium]|nr:TetR/AcrR family transcriptional regulator [Eubacteriales bacterium]